MSQKDDQMKDLQRKLNATHARKQALEWAMVLVNSITDQAALAEIAKELDRSKDESNYDALVQALINLEQIAKRHNIILPTS